MSMSLAVNDFKSDYLCDVCGGIVYCDSNDTSRQFCINSSCQRYNHAFTILDPSAKASPRLHKELAEEEAKLIALVESCDHEALAMYVYSLRFALIDSAVTRRVMPSIPMWHALGDLLILMNAHSPRGSDRSEKTFDSIIKMSHRRSKDLNFIEDIENGRYKIVQLPGGQMRVIMMKYLIPIHDMLKVYGLASSGDLTNESDLFKFQDIDELVISDVDLKPGVDMADFFNSLWPYVITLRYGFGLYYRTALQYRYTPARVDIPYILGVSYSLKSREPVFVSKEILSRHFSKYQEHAEGRTFDQLMIEYAESHEKVPIMVSVGNRVILDPLTLLYFVIHLNGQAIENNRLRNGRDIAKMKKKAADIFEAKVRNELHKYGYTGPDSAVKVKYDYDVIGISEARKQILVIDAKFRDVSPSSISAHTLVSQELMEPEEGLYYEAERHRTRVDYFLNNLGLFKQHLKPIEDLRDYQVRAYVVTKHTPLISQYKNIGVLSLTDLVESELRA
jgi:hypothetical protein